MEIAIAKGSGNNSISLERFYGLNRKRRPELGEMEDMYNMTSEEYPCASTCGGREAVATAYGEIKRAVAPDSAFTPDITGFTGVSGNAFYYNGIRKTEITGSRTSNTLSIDLPPDCEWEIEKMGDTYIINGYCSKSGKGYMFYYDIETDTFSYGGTVMPSMILTVGEDSNGTYLEAFCDCGGVSDYTITYSDGTEFNCGDYLSLYHGGGGTITTSENLWGLYFKEGDEITIEGFRATNEGQFFTYSSDGVQPLETITDFSGSNTVDTEDMASVKNLSGSLVTRMTVKGFSNVTSVNGQHKMYINTFNKSGNAVSYLTFGPAITPRWYAGVTVALKKPALSSICIHQGRVWGASPSGRYIYASASDDIFSYSSADMVDGFAWRMPLDTSGAVTAIRSYNGELVIFKSESLSIVAGYSVRNYNMNTLKGIGAISGDSVAVTPAGIMFLSYCGFSAYNGATPKLFGEKLGKKYKSAVSGFDGRRYYSSATNINGMCELIVYDTKTDMWHREDNLNAVGFFPFRDGMYVCDKDTVYKLHSDFNNVEWSMTPAPVYGMELGGLSEVWVCAEIIDGGELTVMTKDNGIWHECESFTQADGVAVYRAPVRYQKSTALTLRLKGRGRVIIHSVELIGNYGGRRYKERL